MPKLYVAICGEIGAGKGTLVRLLKEGLIKSGVSAESCRFSDVPRAHLVKWGLAETRENMQYVTTTLRQHYGRGILPAIFKPHVMEKRAEVVLIDGPRWPEDEEFIRALQNNLIVYITAPRKIRLARINDRRENEGEEKITMSDFIRQEKRSVECYIPILGSHADIKMENGGDESALQELAEKLLEVITGRIHN